jgi:hypothetical protein
MADRKRTKGHIIQWPKEKEQKDIQYNGRKKKNKRTYNTMAERKRTKGHAIQWPKEKNQKDIQSIVLYVLLFFFFRPLYCMSFCSFSFCHCIACPFVFFLSAIVLYVLLFQWPKEKEQKDKQYNAERKRTKGQTIQCPKEKEQKDKQYNGRKKKNKYNGRQKKNKMTYNTK